MIRPRIFSFQNKIEKLVHLVDFIVRKEVLPHHVRPRINKNDTITIITLNVNKILGKPTVRQVFGAMNI